MITRRSFALKASPRSSDPRADGEWNWIGPYIAEQAVPFDRLAQKSIAPEDLEKAKNLDEKISPRGRVGSAVRGSHGNSELRSQFGRDCRATSRGAEDTLHFPARGRPGDARGRTLELGKRRTLVRPVGRGIVPDLKGLPAMSM